MIENDWFRMTYGAICLSAALKADFGESSSSLTNVFCGLQIQAAVYTCICTHVLCVYEKNICQKITQNIWFTLPCVVTVGSQLS